MVTRFHVGDFVRLTEEAANGSYKGRRMDTVKQLFEGVVVTQVRRNPDPYIMWDIPECPGCYDKFLEYVGGPW